MAANSGFPAIVVSGSGSSYLVQLNPQATPPGATLTATVLQIDPSETVPAGSYVIVVQTQVSPPKYVFQPPCWL
jgi:hypothetical protein